MSEIYVPRREVGTGDRVTKDSRPSLNRLMDDAKKRRIDVVLVWKLDRFGRSLRHLVNALADLEALGIAFVSQHCPRLRAKTSIHDQFIGTCLERADAG